MTAGLISATKGEQAPAGGLVSASPDELVSEVLARMTETGLTQLPVLEEGRSVGSVRENRLLGKVLKEGALLGARVRDVMDESFPVVEEDAGSDEVMRHLHSSVAVLVEEYGRITGIITRHDVLDSAQAGARR